MGPSDEFYDVILYMSFCNIHLVLSYDFFTNPMGVPSSFISLLYSSLLPLFIILPSEFRIMQLLMLFTFMG